MENSELPYISLDDFNARVKELTKTQPVLNKILTHPKSKIKTWEQLPPHLIQDLFRILECKPNMQKY